MMWPWQQRADRANASRVFKVDESAASAGFAGIASHVFDQRQPLRFLSEEWVRGFNIAVDHLDLPAPDADDPLNTQNGSYSMAQVIEGGPDGEVCTLLRVNDGSLKMELVSPGRVADLDPTITVRMSWEDAVGLSKGDLSPVEALTGGHIRVRGDLSVLIASQGVLDLAREHLTSLGTETTY